MGDNSTPNAQLTEKSPSVYQIWQMARSKGGSEGEIEDRYRELLEKYGHRDVHTAQWTADSGFMKARRTISKQQGANG